MRRRRGTATAICAQSTCQTLADNLGEHGTTRIAVVEDRPDVQRCPGPTDGRVCESRRACERSPNAGDRVGLVSALCGALAVAVVVGAAAAVPAAVRSQPAGASDPVLNWSDYAQGSPAALAGFVCATAVVPLDYSKPRGTRSLCRW
jgi:hypothetical protein